MEPYQTKCGNQEVTTPTCALLILFLVLKLTISHIQILFQACFHLKKNQRLLPATRLTGFIDVHLDRLSGQSPKKQDPKLQLENGLNSQVQEKMILLWNPFLTALYPPQVVFSKMQKAS
ncbi:uncharacterized protein LOC121382014 [Gigantopelta aegis]|uniref:uncharacterized protein LOC121382014 n=1 Tax=Gigantopelta aegis TaxID=1735272 RepID=UPI001B88C273|nr:uncharacterized protein LOC121377354 isoform X3 [Gigantopelta aegis]XP_041367413.1 uncharacterized protein LOC121382014 [Gigantopelta aegis]